MTIIIAWLMSNWRILLYAVGGAVIAGAGYWYFIHNPKVIDALEADKVELSRQITARDNTIKLYGDIEARKVVINEAVHQQISSLRSEARPRRAVIIRTGRVLPPLPSTVTPAR